ncbi:MAG: 2-iminoacetate synthase ThiH [Elusimicrobiota bacterium]|jgi:2-iminoacetate synthase|nr:2-iminoacetate synthase ThiH [Elusimicrobiota bacterium]
MSFYDEKRIYDDFDFKAFEDKVDSKQIENILSLDEISELDFLALLTKKAVPFLENIAQKARNISINHFGKSIVLFAPLYVSNFCINNCAYCGFSTRNNIERKVLSFDEVEDNAKIVSSLGIRHILLLTGESPVKTSLEYLTECVKILRKYFEAADIEIYPLSVDGYKKLGEAGASGLTIFQETYDEPLYKTLHTKGAKTDYKFRLETLERGGQAGYRNLNLGALLGLGDFVSEVFFMGLHARYLQKKFPSSEIGMSFPRIRAAEGGYKAQTIISDLMLVQAICACRIFINRIGITVSTRENNKLRNNLIPLGVTRMSAASNTQVGGYAKKNNTKGQFEISDAATLQEIKDMIYQRGYQPVLKDWLKL